MGREDVQPLAARQDSWVHGALWAGAVTVLELPGEGEVLDLEQSWHGGRPFSAPHRGSLEPQLDGRDWARTGGFLLRA